MCWCVVGLRGGLQFAGALLLQRINLGLENLDTSRGLFHVFLVGQFKLRELQALWGGE